MFNLLCHSEPLAVKNLTDFANVLKAIKTGDTLLCSV